MLNVDVVCPVCGDNHTIPVTVTEKQSRGEEPINFLCPALDRRYRLFSFYVDTRRRIYASPGMEESSTSIEEQLKAELGHINFKEKLERWNKIDYPPIGLIDEYPQKIQQIINTYCMGYFYPAVTSACCLAERLLNRLVLKTRRYFTSHRDYKKIYDKASFDDWEKMLSLIFDWKLIPENAINLFRDLKPIRHQSIHYNENYDFELVAPIAINKLIAAITEIFGVENRKDIYMVFDIPGEVWVRSAVEKQPFVIEFVLPYCCYAHAVHEIDVTSRRINERLGETGLLTDEEFVELRKSTESSRQ
ncbi:hypothetical protein [Coleofasciculus sp. FACHB-1120]|uniref:hypothetical protein n=1 Tax=Coleofasciculus sp. FACHB-1120 TaxID=2692783 RepID=UPI001685A477|nr:hypothetical protein [Coleofasciculus sp. FACHB-1120]MBD2743485.1 hypothetical protein [Coleofasciculus sp. FACHB-1120]